MTTLGDAGFVVSYYVLWILVLCLCATVYVLARHVGMLHIRAANAGARMTDDGPIVGATISEFHAHTLTGQEVVIGGSKKRHTLLVFITPGCKSCLALSPALRALEQAERDIQVFLISFADPAPTRAFLTQHDLLHISTICSLEVVSLFGITSMPHAVIIDKDGVVRGKGIVNTSVHLESILNTVTTGYASADDRVRHKQNAGVVLS